MLHHVSFAVGNLARSEAFYNAILETLGYRRVSTGHGFVGWGLIDGEDMFAIKDRGKNSVIPGDGFHLSFAAPSRESVERFYQVALANGGKDNGGVGLHLEYGPNYYAAFVSDPDGYRVEATVNRPV